MSPLVVTFDLFSALVDSRTGGSAALGSEALYDAWDPRNKAEQGAVEAWRPWRVTATAAMTDTLASLGIDADPAALVEQLVTSMPDWPLWPGVEDGLREVGRHHRVGLLSNVDDALFASTAAARLVDRDVAFTSERLGVAKPSAAIYRRAAAEVRERGASMVHVATSARDVRGALEADVPVVRLRRPGHHLDPDGPAPTHEVDGLDALAETCRRLVDEPRPDTGPRCSGHSG